MSDEPPPLPVPPPLPEQPPPPPGPDGSPQPDEGPDGDLYARVERALARAPQQDGFLWDRLTARLDPGQWQPKRNAHVVEHETGKPGQPEALVLHCLDSDEYLPLTEQEAFVWRQLDGNHTVRSIEVAYLNEFKTLAGRHLAALLAQLKAGYFLAESARSIYDIVEQVIEEQTAQSRLQRFQQRFAERHLWRLREKGSMAHWLSRLSRAVGSLWCGAALAVLGLLGLVVFSVLFGLKAATEGGSGMAALSFVKVWGSYLVGVIVLLLANTVLSAINRFAAAAALKTQGAEVPRFDVSLRYGLPTFTADLRQMCLLTARGKVAARLYGGLVELAVAGLLSVVALLLPNNLCFNVAALCYVRVFLSLCPWLDTHGYRAAEHLLNMPDLRATSFQLFRTYWWRDIAGICLPLVALWLVLRPMSPPAAGASHWRMWAFVVAATGLIVALVRQGRKAGEPAVQPPETMREQRIAAGFLVSGVVWTLALVWGCLAALDSDVFQQGFVVDLSNAWPLTRVFMLLLLAVPVSCIVAFMGATLVLLGMYGWQWTIQSGLWRNSEQVALVFWCTAVAIAFGPLVAGPSTAAIRFVTILAAVLCVAAGLSLRARARGSGMAQDGVLLATFAAMTLLALVAPAVEGLSLLAASLALAVLAVQRLRRDPLRGAHGWSAAVVAMAALCGLVPAAKTFFMLPVWWPEATVLLAAFASAFVLVAAAPWLLAAVGSKCANVAIMLVSAMASLCVANVLEMDRLSLLATPIAIVDIQIHSALVGSFAAFGLALAAAAAYLYQHVVATARMPVPTVDDEGESDLARLRHGFRLLAATALSDVQQFCGQRAARRLAAGFNAQADSMAWHVALRDGDADLSEFHVADVAGASGTLSAAARALARGVREIAGQAAFDRIVTRVYDSLAWESRELATTYLFGEAPWTKALSQRPVLRRQELRDLLRHMVMFAELTDDHLEGVAKRFEVERFEAGQNIIRQGDVGDTFYVIQEGTVEVVLEGLAGPVQVLAHLQAGDYFGEIALLERCPRTATVQAATKTSVYVLNKADFDAFAEAAGQGGQSVVQTIADVRKLRHVPVLRDLPESQIAVLLSQFTVEELDAGETVFKQGDIGDRFYVIREGEVSITAAQPDGTEREVATLGPGEYFGEIALLSSVPRTATAATKTQVQLWALDGESFKTLMESEHVHAGTLEQTATRRVLQLKKRILGA